MDIKAFWKAVLAQKRDELPAYFSPDAVIRWHCSNEQFTVEEYIRANCDYPGEWDGTIERIEKTNAGYITAVKVFSGKSLRILSCCQFRYFGERSNCRS